MYSHRELDDSWQGVDLNADVMTIFYLCYSHTCLLKQAGYTLLKMGRYYNTTMHHYWDMLVK